MKVLRVLKIKTDAPKKTEYEKAKSKPLGEGARFEAVEKAAQKELVERKMFKNFTEDDVKRISGEVEENELDLNDAMDLADEVYNNKNKEEE